MQNSIIIYIQFRRICEMKPFLIGSKNNSEQPLYIQLYRHIKGEILAGNLLVGEKLPSLRNIAKESGLSITTTTQAYEQLLTEGYITSRPQSGYYVAEIPTSAVSAREPEGPRNPEMDDYTFDRGKYLHDSDTFDFDKWKKCSARVFTEYADMLLFESDVQGEAALRFEICKYLYSSRGVTASPQQVVIGAGSQQLTSHLARILTEMGIDLVCTEDPGYTPIQNIFRDRGFGIAKIPVTENGIMIEKLPMNIPTAVYVSPANQFPTGSVMPVGARYRLLEWAATNGSIILEDDYDSELRYFGKPVPALQGLDDQDRVVYLGSFSATLFPAIKISYMILPPDMATIFDAIKDDYTQTCSKAEQLTLALFMEDGYYYTNIRKLRNLYAQKLEAVVSAFERYGADFIETTNTKSGINITLRVTSQKPAAELCAIGKDLGINIISLAQMGYGTTHPSARTQAKNKERDLIFYFNQIPLETIDSIVKKLIHRWI